MSGTHGTMQRLYDGPSAGSGQADRLLIEYSGAGTILRRFGWGPGIDEPVFQDDGGALSCAGAPFLHADHQGSVIAAATCTGVRVKVNTYDEYGVPAASGTNWGRFQYTGQAWVPELGMYYYKARFYSPMLGRFMQTDPIGYDDQINLYAYVGNDPINSVDPLGTCGKKVPTTEIDGEIVVTGTIPCAPPPSPREQLGVINRPADTRKNQLEEPQNNQAKPAPKTRAQCAAQAFGENWKSLGLDALGWAANFAFPGGSAATAIAGSVIGVTGIGLAVADNAGPGDAAVSGSLAYGGKLGATAEGLLRGAGSALGHRIDVGALTATTLYDAGKAIASYNRCMAGN